MNGFGLTHIIRALPYVEGVLALIALTLLVKNHVLGQYKSLAAILVLIFSWSVYYVFNFLTSYQHPADRHLLNEIYFYFYWSSLAVEAILMPIFCYRVLTRLFSSLPEMLSISTRVFLWIVFLWCVMSARFFFMPHMNAFRLIAVEAIQLRLLEGGVSVLTAMVVFVCIRPLGLRLRSPLPAFGLGLIFSAMIIFSHELLGKNSPQHYFWIVIFGSVALCAQLISWVAGISWSEPARQIVSV